MNKNRNFTLALATPDNKEKQYAFSDFPMPVDYPMWPSGSCRVQEYLERLCKTNFGVAAL